MPDDDSLPAPPPPLADAPLTSLFLDFDGTLVDLAERHDSVVVPAETPRLVGTLARLLDGRIAIISGRPAAEVLHYLHPDAGTPPFAISGSHGLEYRWTDGRAETPPRPDAMDDAVSAFRALAARHEGLVVENKPLGAALHYRLAPDCEPACDALAGEIADREGFAIQRGKMVVELKLPGSDKGDAVRRFMAEAPMRGSRPVFVGDDLTDEAGFAATAAFGGYGVLVGGPRATAARYRLAGVDDVHRWLGDFACQAAGLIGGVKA